MKIKILYGLLVFRLIGLFDSTILLGQSYVTYEINSGRLGDRLIAYAHAKWLSYKYGLIMLYRPFEYSDKLMLSDIEKSFDKATIAHVIQPHRGDNPNFYDQNNILFDILYFPECKAESADRYSFDVEWKDPKFKAILVHALSPKIKIETIQPPKDCLSLAIHVRKNSGGYDAPLSYEVIEKFGYLPDGYYADFALPLKHPSDEYYIEQIKTVSNLLQNPKLYIFIFTDDPNPAIIVEKYKKLLKEYNNLIFDYRKTANNHTLNVLEDLYSMINFDMFIRPASNLGYIASALGNFKVDISPKSYQKIGHKIIIDQVDIKKNI